MTTELMSTLDALRPKDQSDALWPRSLEIAARDRILATPVAVSPKSAGHKRRVASIAVAAAVVISGGVGIAAATGLMPKAFVDAYSHWQSNSQGAGVDPATAERVASIPGPDGTVMSVFVSHGSDGARCVAAVFESATGTEQPGPSDFTGLGDYCRPTVDSGQFGDGAGFFADPHGFIYDAAAGEAVRAEIRTSAGAVLPTVLVEGRFFGWGPLPAGAERPTLVGFASDGTIIGTS